ncbi:hypothetical protein LOZ65_006565 [Ophidiomyces ophidiicola]|nr:hypothetical protein LOZ65_006565 [Ophidiomyces ophidiicola]
MKLSTAVLLACPLLGSCFRVHTSNGPIFGHPASAAPGVTEFLGIPYAQPPIGQLRFKPPQKLTVRRRYVAANYRKEDGAAGVCLDCVFTPSRRVSFPAATPNFPRILSAFTGGLGNAQSEDCLTLNVWTKSTGARKRPVLVFFYGGRFTTGDTNTPFYAGEFFADAEDVVVVTVNYRLSIFGFPGAPGQPQNLGLRDQRFAVEWLRDNVRAFGGDPERITLFGQSSGSLSIDAYAYAYKHDPIVAGLILHSGTIFTFPLNTNQLATRHWYNASTLVGCGSEGDVFNCMMTKTADELKAAAARIPAPPNTSAARSQPVFQPVPDGEVVFNNYDQLSSQGKFARIPIIVGHTDQESAFYNISAWARGTFQTDQQWAEFVTEVFGCTSMKSADYRTRHHIPVWRYRYFGDWDNTRLFPNSRAYHGVDLHMIFGNSEAVSGDPESPEQTKLKRVMQKSWAAFAADPWRGPRDLGWPTYRKNGRTVARFGYANKHRPSFVPPRVYDATCPAA